MRDNYTTTCPTETAYPYTSANYFTNTTYTYTGINTCKTTTPRVKLNYRYVFQYALNGNETELKSILVKNGPVVVSVHASQAMLNYKSGILYDPNCPVATATKTQCDFSNGNHGETFFALKIQ